MLLNFGDWQFDVDMTATMAYSAQEAEEHCDCGYCRNFYAAVDRSYPQLRPFLGSFGIHIEAPDELMPYDLPEGMLYDGYYAVSGRILQAGREPIVAGNGEIVPLEGKDLQISTDIPEPCFLLNVSVTLPWVLNEPMREVFSPANEPSFLERMWNRLLGKLNRSEQKS